MKYRSFFLLLQFFSFFVFFSLTPGYAEKWRINFSCDFPLFTKKDLTYARQNLAKIDPDRKWQMGDDPYGKALEYALRGDKEAGAVAVQALMDFRIHDPGSSHSRDEYRWAGWVPSTFALVRSLMTPQQRQAFVERYNEYTLAMLNNEWGTPQQALNNYADSFFALSLQFALTIACSNPQMAKEILNHDLESRLDYYLSYFENQNKGGEPFEGSQYGYYFPWHMTILLPTLKQYGLDLFAKTDWFPESAAYYIYATSPGPVHPKGSTAEYRTIASRQDNELNPYPPAASNQIVDYMTMLAGEFRETKMGKFIRRWLNTSDVTNNQGWWVALTDRGGGELGFEGNLPTDYYAPGTQTFLSRNHWDLPGAMTLDYFGGVVWAHGHQHYDAGSFRIVACNRHGKCREMLRPSNGYFTCMNILEQDQAQTAAHNSLVFGDEMQGQARRDAAGSGFVLALDRNPHYSFLVNDLTDAYLQENRLVEKAVRQVFFDKDLGAFLFLDRITTKDTDDLPAKQVPATVLFHLPELPVVNLKQRVVTETNGDIVLKISTLLPAANDSNQKLNINVTDLGDFSNSGDCHHEAPGFYQYRVEVTTKGMKNRYLLHLIQPKISGEADVTASADDRAEPHWINVSLKSKTGMTRVSFHKEDLTNVWYAHSSDPNQEPTQKFPLNKHVPKITVSWDKGVLWER